MLIETLDYSLFESRFRDYNRLDHFPNTLRDLFSFLDDFSDVIELDVISICCDFTEEPIDDALRNYGLDSIEELEENTLVIYSGDNIVLYQNY